MGRRIRMLRFLFVVAISSVSLLACSQNVCDELCEKVEGCANDGKTCEVCNKEKWWGLDEDMVLDCIRNHSCEAIAGAFLLLTEEQLSFYDCIAAAKFSAH
jgi:hypothetical protein